MSEDKEQEEFYPEYNGFTLAQLAAEQVAVKNQIEDFAAEKSIWQKRFDHLRLHRIPKMMEDMNIDGVKLTDIGRLATQGDLYASIKKDKKEDAYLWLGENGFGDLIKGTVNSSSLKALIKEQTKSKEPVLFPDDLFSISFYTKATITKG